MAIFTNAALVSGLVLSSIAGLACYMGTSSLWGQLDWMPCSNLLLTHPAGSLGSGLFLLLVGLFCQPTRIE
jgi:hypothetical protein